MIVLEHDAKELLAIQGFPVPGGIQLAQVPQIDTDRENDQAGPWIVKAQIPSGSAEIAAGTRVATSAKEVAEATAQLLGTTVLGHPVETVRVERQMDAVGTAYLSFACDPRSAGIRVQAAGEGAVDRTQNADSQDHIKSDVVVPDPNAVIACVNRLAAQLPNDRRDPIVAAARQLAPLYFGYEALHLEINPLLILSDGTWTAGDVTMIIDENALFRHPEIISMIERRENVYRDIRRKREFGLDQLILDQDGRIGLIIAGAGLGLMTVDELDVRGHRPFNLINAHIDALGTNSTPLATALEWMNDAETVQCILIVVFEGIVDLTSFADSLVDAVNELTELKPQIVACLVGKQTDRAAAALQTIAGRVTVVDDWDVATNLITVAVDAAAEAP